MNPADLERLRIVEEWRKRVEAEMDEVMAPMDEPLSAPRIKPLMSRKDRIYTILGILVLTFMAYVFIGGIFF